MAVKRNTIQKALVLEAVQRLQCHATAEEVYQEIINKYPGIGRGTVYRNLKQLAESGKIQKVDIPGSAERFDHICSKHYHMKCEKCGAIFDADMEIIPDLEKQITDAHGFEVTGHDIIFKGICPACAAA